MTGQREILISIQGCDDDRRGALGIVLPATSRRTCGRIAQWRTRWTNDPAARHGKSMEVVLDEQKATARTSLRTCAPTLTANNRQQHATILCILMALHSRVDRAPPANNTTEISLLPRDPKRSACSTCC